jgi:hypothetical protein
MASEHRSTALNIPAGCATSEKCRAVIRYLVDEGFSFTERPRFNSSRGACRRMCGSAERSLGSGVAT